jgi:hypothetical protein
LPQGFPTPSGVTYTGTRADGPSTVVQGFTGADISGAFDAYRGAFKGASGYQVTKDEHEEVDAEVNFAGPGTTGQVKLVQACKDRTSITITARPA